MIKTERGKKEYSKVQMERETGPATQGHGVELLPLSYEQWSPISKKKLGYQSRKKWSSLSAGGEVRHLIRRIETMLLFFQCVELTADD
jgi:hypothetical protein